MVQDSGLPRNEEEMTRTRRAGSSQVHPVAFGQSVNNSHTLVAGFSNPLSALVSGCFPNPHQLRRLRRLSAGFAHPRAGQGLEVASVLIRKLLGLTSAAKPRC
jgi:hypothetical protein